MLNLAPTQIQEHRLTDAGTARSTNPVRGKPEDRTRSRGKRKVGEKQVPFWFVSLYAIYYSQ
jgi:hypothetical protein